MLVVADSTPISTLICIGHADILPALFTQVLIPPQVVAELEHPKSPKLLREFLDRRPDWLNVRPPRVVERIPPLDPGEEAAISLAQECHAELAADR